MDAPAALVREPWDGILCSHCGYRASYDELERSVEQLHTELS